MSVETNLRTNSVMKLVEAFGSLFSSGIDVESIDETELPEELNDVLKSLSNKERNVEQAINVASNSSKRGGFAKINPTKNPIKNAGTEKAMRDTYKKVQQELGHEERE